MQNNESNPWDVLYKNTIKKKENEKLLKEERNRLANISSDNLTQSDILYATNDELKKKIEKYNLNHLSQNIYVDAECKNRLASEYIKPVENGKLSSPYGMRNHPVLKQNIFHNGVDIAVPVGTPINASSSGTVIKSDWNGGYGKYIEIKHNDGNISFYGHLNELNVKVGDKVQCGQVIGKSGNTAGKGKNGKIMTTGPHLHFGMKDKSGASLNPLNYIKNHSY